MTEEERRERIAAVIGAKDMDEIENEGKDVQYVKKTPPGWKFLPTDEEIIFEYLHKRILNEKLPCDNVIKEVHLYELDAPDLAKRYESSQQEGHWYFFTDRIRKYPGGNRPARSTPSGFWKLTGLKTEIEHNGKKIGVKNTLNFYWGPQQGRNSRTEWMMREYSIKEFQIPKEPAGLEPDMKLDNAVLCMVYRNLNENAGRKRQNPSVHPQQSIQSPEQSFRAEDNKERACEQIPENNMQVGNFNLDAMETKREDYAEKMPPGWKFCPTDKQIISEYLYKRIHSQTIPCKNVINEVHLYEFDAPALIEEYQSSEQHKSWYFFTDRTRKYLGGKRPARSTPNGFWKATEADTLIKDQGKVIGQRMTLKFLWGHQQEGKHWDSGWMMREYRIKEFQIPCSQKRKGQTPNDPAGLECDRKLDEAVVCKVYKVQNKNAGRKRREASGNSSSDSSVDVVDQTQSLNQLAPIQVQNTIQLSGPFSPVPCPGYDPNNYSNGLMFSQHHNQVNPNYFSTMNQTHPCPTNSVVYPNLPNWCPCGSDPCSYERESGSSNFLNVNGMGVPLGLSDMQHFHPNLCSDMMALSQDIHQRQLSLSLEQSQNLSSDAVLDVACWTQSLSQDPTVDLPSSHPCPVPCSTSDSMYNNGWRLFNQVNSSYSSTANQNQSYETNSVVNPNLPNRCTGSSNLNNFYVDPSQSGFLDENGFVASDMQRLRPNLYSSMMDGSQDIPEDTPESQPKRERS